MRQGIGEEMADTKTLIEQAYSALNQRDIDGALALMTEDVSDLKLSCKTDAGIDTGRWQEIRRDTSGFDQAAFHHKFDQSVVASFDKELMNQ
jgi:hypothetical protein